MKKKILYQFQHQLIKNRKKTVLVAQVECVPSQMFDHAKDIAKRHPLPPNHDWLVCVWDSEYFVKGVSK